MDETADVYAGTVFTIYRYPTPAPKIEIVNAASHRFRLSSKVMEITMSMAVTAAMEGAILVNVV